MPRRERTVERRTLPVTVLAILLGIIAAYVAKALTALIGLVTNLAFFGRIDTALVEPAGHHLGAWVIVLPIAGGLVVGVMARWGSKAIRGHGIPEAMEQVLLNESRIPPRMTWLKPLSSAVAIGTGGPFGAEGPIIATGGAIGSLLGQVLHVTADERKTLLAAGAAAGMAAIFSAPVSAVLLAVELLLFERRARSLIPVALATVTATGIRYALEGSAAVFPMQPISPATLPALALYVALGAVVGIASVAVTRLTYGIEDAFERLPIHWMWWPAIGGLAVGLIGYAVPQTLGVGYANIEQILSGHTTLAFLALLCVAKLASWSIALGSGTSGGTLAPLFTIGGAFGAAAGIALASIPGSDVDPRVAALVGMAAMFAGASRAVLTSVVFAFEITQQPHGLLPLLAGCMTAYLVSGQLMGNSIMTEKIARRGVRVPSEYGADYLDRITVGDACTREVVTLPAAQLLATTRAWLFSGDPDAGHQGYPIVEADGRLVGVLTRRDLIGPAERGAEPLRALVTRAPAVVGEDHSLREAADHMVDEDIGRLVVVDAAEPTRMTGFITRGDLLAAHARRLRESREVGRAWNLRATRAPAGPTP
ncbi:CBS domain-containing protein [Lysobacter lacus]|uniref:CBS domain-containing protein n=2 Tax=Cognatilysobacter lacus TaxID=1643323 RepID=A0A5D8Z666_9GAMM|nr:CBS domain-containing protein [Lysobacter lacus]